MDLRELRKRGGSSRETRKLETVSRTLATITNAGLYPSYVPIQSAGTNPTCVIDGREVVMLCSNNYLGLAQHPEVLEGARRALEAHGVGPGGSRVLCGNVDLLIELERRVADLAGTEDALTFPTGYMANVGAVSGLLDPFLGGLHYRKGAAAVIADERNHATVFDGIALSHAKRFIYAHNDIDDLVRKLEAAKDHHPRMIITEGVFSVDGEVSPIPEIVRVAEEYEAVLMIDDAHGFGVIGERGGGTLEHFGLQGCADLVMGSFDKALGGMGGFLAGRHDVIQYLRMTSRPYLSSSAMPAVMAGAMIEAIDLCIRGRELRARLRANADQLRAELLALGFRILGDGQLPVVPVLIGQEEAAIAFSERLLEHGVYLPCYRFPVIARGTARVRATATVLHRKEHLARVVEAFQKVDAELGLLREQNAAA